MASFSIKNATPEDIPVVIKIQEATWEPTYRDILSSEQIEYMFTKIYSSGALKKQMLTGHHFLLLLNGSEPEGFASFSEEEPHGFKLHKIYVLPSTQGSGAGKFLLNAVEKYVKSIGGTKLSLNVNRFNKARSFYEKMDFIVTGEADIAIGPYWMNDFILEKQLG